MQSHQIYCINSVVIYVRTHVRSYVLFYSYVILLTSYLNAAGFLNSFYSSCDIMDWVYRKWADGRVEGGGGWETEGGLKQPFGFKLRCCAFSIWHELIQSVGWAKTAVRNSLVPHAVILMLLRAKKCILIVQQHQQKSFVKVDMAIHD